MMGGKKNKMRGLRVAILAADGFEEVELTAPLKAMRKMGADVEVISLAKGKIRGVRHMKKGKKVKVDRVIDYADPRKYDLLMLPGGLYGPDELRQSEKALNFVRSFADERRPIAVICHAAQVMISAGVVSGRRLAAWPAIKADLRNAGAEWVDEPMVRDDNIVSSRHPGDIPAFIKGIRQLMDDYREREVEKTEAERARLAG